MRGGGRGECSATQYQPSDDTDEVLLRSRFKVEPVVVPGADSEAVLGEALEEAPGADSAVDPGAHQGADEVSAEEGLAAVEGASESLAGCTCFASYRLFLCFLSSHLSPHHGSGNVYDIHTSKTPEPSYLPRTDAYDRPDLFAFKSSVIV
jgi:hypothetical protein